MTKDLWGIDEDSSSSAQNDGGNGFLVTTFLGMTGEGILRCAQNDRWVAGIKRNLTQGSALEHRIVGGDFYANCRYYSTHHSGKL